MALRAAAVLWFLFAAVGVVGALRDLSERDASGVVFGVSLALASAWIGLTLLLRRASRDTAVVAACLAGFLIVIIVGTVVRGSMDLFPPAMAVITAAVIAGGIPLRKIDR
jgi:hypothetical protein